MRTRLFSNISRRKFLYLGGMSGISLLSGLKEWLGADTFQGKVGERTHETSLSLNNDVTPDIDIALRAVRNEVSLVPGRPTVVWSYKGDLLKGPPEALTHMDGSYLGPIIRAKRGQKIRIGFVNGLTEETTIHWHGLDVPAEMDGHPRFSLHPGERFNYEYEIINRAGTYWYHPHPHGRTGPQVNNGLAGLFLVSDGEEGNLSLPRGNFDVPLVIQDRTFDRNNQFIYQADGGGMGRMDSMQGFLGNRILVNGRLDYTLPVATRIYRFRLLNGSNSRIYNLAWEDGTPLTVIGTDGGLLDKPEERGLLLLAPGERVEVWADFSTRPVGSELALLSLPFDAGSTGMDMGGRGAMVQGGLFEVMKIRVDRREPEFLVLPERLTDIPRYDPNEAYNLLNPKTFRLAMDRMTWTINGRTFQMEAVTADEVVELNRLEVWEFINDGFSGGMMGGMMSMPHPMHLHGPQFQVLERRGGPLDRYVDRGWKDTVLVMPGERVKILFKAKNYKGLFLYHCHNLEHEDQGMMRNYLVR